MARTSLGPPLSGQPERHRFGRVGYLELEPRGWDEAGKGASCGQRRGRASQTSDCPAQCCSIGDLPCSVGLRSRILRLGRDDLLPCRSLVARSSLCRLLALNALLPLRSAAARPQVLHIDLQRKLHPLMKDMTPLPSIYDPKARFDPHSLSRRVVAMTNQNTPFSPSHLTLVSSPALSPQFIAANQKERADNVIKGSKKEQMEQVKKDILAFKEKNGLDQARGG